MLTGRLPIYVPCGQVRRLCHETAPGSAGNQATPLDDSDQTEGTEGNIEASGRASSMDFELDGWWWAEPWGNQQARTLLARTYSVALEEPRSGW